MRLNYFNFKKLKDEYLLTTDLGTFVFLSKDDFIRLIHNDPVSDELNQKLQKAGILCDENQVYYDDELVQRVRQGKAAALSATSLHIFVVTTRCNMRCVYCQANNGETQPNSMMSFETARCAVDVALKSPEKYLTFEFQGGEPLVNFPVIQEIVRYAEENKEEHQISYSLVSNLLLLTDEMIDFFKEHHFGISTSIDGPEDLHNWNRMIADGTGSFQGTVAGLKRLQKAGLKVGAIETTTRPSLTRAKDIVRTYYDLGFDSIFIRPLTPLGKAARFWDKVGYTTDEFLAFYKEACQEIEKLNTEERKFTETTSMIFKERIFGNTVNYMELRSPCGAGIGQMAYFTDGNVFTCDEGRMVYEMGSDAFKLGNVYEDSYSMMVGSPTCETVCRSSILESLPSCCDCVYQPYCGVCPVVNLSLEKDIIEKNPNGYRCRINKGILDYLFEKLHDSEKVTI